MGRTLLLACLVGLAALAWGTACLPSVAAKEATAATLHLLPDGELGMVAVDGPALAASCDGTPAEPAWRAGDLGRAFANGTIDMETIRLDSRTRADMAVAGVRLRWAFDAPPAAAGPVAGFTVLVGMDGDPDGGFARGAVGPFTVLPGRNDLEVSLDAQPVLPAGSSLALEARLHAPGACAGGGSGAEGLVAVAGGSALVVQATHHLLAEAHAAVLPSSVVLQLDAASSWGGYAAGLPLDVAFAITGPSSTADAAVRQNRSALGGGRQVATWTWDFAGAQPGDYQGTASARLLDPGYVPVEAAVPVRFRIEGDGTVAAVDAGGATFAPASAAPSPAAPLAPLLAALAVAARYSRARRSATALRTSLPW